eukprot:TRINITY_DN3264_c0_g1_i11.p1 TRINITY_DN3264_c0_g1~~TRINITY_DN3264_c0_g1_i11.p1  ORF type:complete len:364 (-),score=81.54 TRINITY_DN3264_c0_g1_i11:66-1157(-)
MHFTRRLLSVLVVLVVNADDSGSANDMVTLFKIEDEKCGQVTLESKYATYAETFAKLKEGTCSALGYTVPAGEKELDVPVLHHIKIEFFMKKEFVTSDTGSATDMVTLYKIELEKCGQVTLESKYAKYAETAAKLKEGTCSALGYTVPAGEKELDVPVLHHIKIEFFMKKEFVTSDTRSATDMVTLYKIEDEKCGQVTLESKYATYAETFAKLKEGTCSALGYTVPAGEKELDVPVLHHIKIELFTKKEFTHKQSGAVAAGLEGNVTYFVVQEGGLCTEFTIPSEYTKYFEGEMKVGTCSSQGYTVPVKTVDFDWFGVPIRSEIFSKANRMVTKTAIEDTAAQLTTLFAKPGEVQSAVREMIV